VRPPLHGDDAAAVVGDREVNRLAGARLQHEAEPPRRLGVRGRLRLHGAGPEGKGELEVPRRRHAPSSAPPRNLTGSRSASDCSYAAASYLRPRLAACTRSAATSAIACSASWRL